MDWAQKFDTDRLALSRIFIGVVDDSRRHTRHTRPQSLLSLPIVVFISSRMVSLSSKPSLLAAIHPFEQKHHNTEFLFLLTRNILMPSPRHTLCAWSLPYHHKNSHKGDSSFLAIFANQKRGETRTFFACDCIAEARPSTTARLFVVEE